jgi:hypothetical protein
MHIPIASRPKSAAKRGATPDTKLKHATQSDMDEPGFGEGELSETVINLPDIAATWSYTVCVDNYRRIRTARSKIPVARYY